MNSYRTLRYSETDKMSDLILQNYDMLHVIERFGISLGFKELSIGEVCKAHGVDCYTLLAMVNLLTTGERVSIDYKLISIESLMEYLKSSHYYFLEYKLPSIRKRLHLAISDKEALSLAVINYFDEYVAEVRNHMDYEENELFGYIRVGQESANMRLDIEEFCDHHDSMESKLSELKSILIKYYPAQSSYELSGVLIDIFNCERELADHARVEDDLLMPAIKVARQ